MFFGRENVLEEMLALWDKRVSSLVTCRGRRRIGKSTLIAEFARKSGARFVCIEGLRPSPDVDNSVELAHFAEMLALQCETSVSVPTSWLEAFKRLADVVRDDERTVVLLDEISWMGHYDKLFADKLKIAWDRMLKPHAQLVVVLCGSVSSWIRENIIDNSAYMGRRSGDYVIGELSLRDCLRFWGDSVNRVDLREVLDVLSVTGGVPRYLEEINPSLSADENIRRMAFRRKSVLREDFDDMFGDVVVREANFSGKVLRALVEGPRTVSELSEALGVERGGNISSALARMEEAGFVASDNGRNPETSAPVREKRFRIKDNYARFYLKYIEPVKQTIDMGGFDFHSLSELKGWNAILGLAFENLVVNHYAEFLPRLGLANTLLTSVAPYRKNANPKRKTRGCQVDLLLQGENVMCLVEIKRKGRIGEEVIAEMEEKVSAIKRRKGVSVRTALVYDGRLAGTVAPHGYFSAIVDVREMF